MPMDLADLGDFRTTVENRSARLETGMQELQSQTSKFENWFSQITRPKPAANPAATCDTAS